jgi:amino acid transporter
MAGVSQSAPTALAGATGGFYARKASGLVRQLSLRDTVLLNICYISIPLGLLYITQLGGLFPGVSLGLAVILASLIAIPHYFVYGNFAGAMPRSGGDYLSISRSIHPFLGYLVNSTFTVLQIFSTAFILNFVPIFALPALFQTLAIVTGDQQWATWATNVSGQNGQFFISGFMIVSIGLMAIFNVPLMLRFFTVLMALSLLGLAVTVVALLFVDQNSFASNFSKFEPVSKVVSDAHAAGLGSATFSLGATFASITILFGAIGLGQVTSYVAGEVRQPGRTIVRGMFISLAIAGLGLAVIAFLAQNAFGSDFLNSAQFLANSGKWPVPATPFINLFLGIAIPNVWLAALLGVAMVAGVWAVAVPTFLFCTRNMLAYSFDRVLPTRVGEVSDRTHTPILATVIVMIGMIGFLAGWVYSSASFTVYISVSNIVVFLPFAIVGLAAVIFPFRRKAMYADSPITKMKLAGIPLFSIVGAVDAVLMAIYLYLLLSNGSVTGATNTTALTVLGLVVAFLAAIWIIAFFLARQRGLDLSVVQDQLPPE